jgi:soluble lytic murein transglycosylase-like protein
MSLLVVAVLALGPLQTVPLALAEPPAAVDPHLARWSAFVGEASARFAIPDRWIYAVIAAESGGRTALDGAPITSIAGAVGLMQLMPETYWDMRMRHGLGPDPHVPRDNILAGTAYLRAMYDRFGFPGLFAAYHAGPGRYRKHLTTGRPLPRATIAYLKTLRKAGVAASDIAPRTGKTDVDQSLFFDRSGQTSRPSSRTFFLPRSEARGGESGEERR